jgi:DNA-binding transcriptional ArsR family regulator
MTDIATIDAVMRTLADPTRRAVFERIVRSDEITVGEPCGVPRCRSFASVVHRIARWSRSITGAVSQFLITDRSVPSATRRLTQRIGGPCGIDEK